MRRVLQGIISVAIAIALSSSALLLTAVIDSQRPLGLGATHVFTLVRTEPGVHITKEQVLSRLADAAREHDIDLYRIAGELVDDNGRQVYIPVNSGKQPGHIVPHVDGPAAVVGEPGLLDQIDFLGDYAVVPYGGFSAESFSDDLATEGIHITISGQSGLTLSLLLSRVPTLPATWILLGLAVTALVIAGAILNLRRDSLTALNGQIRGRPDRIVWLLMLGAALVVGWGLGAAQLSESPAQAVLRAYSVYFLCATAIIGVAALIGFLIGRRLSARAVHMLALRSPVEQVAERLIDVLAATSVLIVLASGIVSTFSLLDQREDTAAGRIWEELASHGKIILLGDPPNPWEDEYPVKSDNPAVAAEYREFILDRADEHGAVLSYVMPAATWMFHSAPETLADVVLVTPGWRDVAGFGDEDLTELSPEELTLLRDDFGVANAEIWSDPGGAQALLDAMHFYKLDVDRPVGFISGGGSQQVLTPREIYLIEFDHLEPFDGFFLTATISTGNLFFSDFASLNDAIRAAGLEADLRAYRAADRGLAELVSSTALLRATVTSLVVTLAAAILVLWALAVTAVRTRSRYIFLRFTDGDRPERIAGALLKRPTIFSVAAALIATGLMVLTREWYFGVLAAVLIAMPLVLIGVTARTIPSHVTSLLHREA